MRIPLSTVREAAAQIIPWEKDLLSRDVEPVKQGLVECVADPSPSWREDCIRSLGGFVKAPSTDERLARLLVRLLRTDPSEGVRDAAANALGALTFPFDFVQQSLLEIERAARLGTAGEDSFASLLGAVGPTPAVLSNLISQLQSEDPKLRTRGLRTLSGIKPLPHPIVDALVVALRESYGQNPKPTDLQAELDEQSFRDEVIRTLAEGASDQPETVEAFIAILRMATRQPLVENQRMAGMILSFQDKLPLTNKSLLDAIVGYGQTAYESRMAPLLVKAGAPGLTVLVNQIPAIRASDIDSWVPCHALRDAPAVDKASLVPRLLDLMTNDQSLAGACAAAALAGSSEDHSALLHLLNQYRAMWPTRDQHLDEVALVRSCIDGPAWDWMAAALDQIVARNNNPEPLVELFRSEPDRPTRIHAAALKRAIEDENGHLRAVAAAILDSTTDNEVEAEDLKDFASTLAKCIADQEFREKALELVTELMPEDPHLIDEIQQAAPRLELALAADVRDLKSDAGLALDFLTKVRSPSRVTVEAVKRYIEVNIGSSEELGGPLLSGPLIDSCNAVKGWAQAAAAAATALKPLLSSKTYQPCAVEAVARALPTDENLPTLLADLVIKSDDEDARLLAASEALGLRAPLGELELLFQSVVLDEKISEWISNDIDDVANVLRPVKIPKSTRKYATRRRGRGPQLPPFPWPPPRWSYLGLFGRDLPRALLGNDKTTLEELYMRLYSALKSIDPNFETGLFGAPGGFALLVKLERVNEDGTPLPAKYRWSEGKVPPLSVADYIAQLFTQSVGYFRAIVFVVTDQSQFDGGNQSLPNLATGRAVLPDEIGSQELKDKQVFALVYSWKRDWDQPPVLISRELSALTHLEKSGIIAALQQVN